MPEQERLQHLMKGFPEATDREALIVVAKTKIVDNSFFFPGRNDPHRDLPFEPVVDSRCYDNPHLRFSSSYRRKSHASPSNSGELGA